MPNHSSKESVRSKGQLIQPVDVVIYHANCPDGFASAWIVHKKYPNAEYIAASHGAKIDLKILNSKNKNILFVDFCYPIDTLQHLLNHNQISILDHHITTLESIAHLIVENSVTGEINLNYSGASLTWNYFFPNKSLPELIQYIEDIDLWNLDYPETKAVMLALNNYPMDFSVWTDLMKDCSQLKNEGQIIQRYVNHTLSDILKHKHRMQIDEFIVPAINAPGAYSSELGNRLAQKNPFSAIYYIQGDEYKISLRSTKEGEDVAKIAQRFNGGGHREAASFKILASQINQERIKIFK